MHKTVVIFIGPPGSGKGTQAKALKNQLNIPHISTGDLFRREMALKTPLGIEAKKKIDKGQYVPDSIVIDMLFQRIAEPDCASGYILDGFPRTMDQVYALEKHVDDKVIVINLALPEDVVVKRLSGRLTCADCGAMYNQYFTPSKVAGVCDVCGGMLYQRSDDQREVILERLKVYYKQTAQIASYYEKQGLLHTINGNIESDKIFEAILKIV